MAVPTVQLTSTVSIPIIGLGTWQSSSEDVKKAVLYALTEAGYRHIDCAWGYGNEKDVGEAIKKSGIPRSEIFITSKLWGTYHSRVEECLDQTLANLGTDYLDLYLVHWPVPMNPKGNHPIFPLLPNGKRDVDHSWKLIDTWKQMEEMAKKGKVKAIGVSNFSKTKLEEILPSTTITSNLDPSYKPTIIPAVDQLELHVYNPQHELVKFLREKGIVPQAYSPLGSSNSPLLADETVQKIAQERGLTAADVLIGWLISHQIVALPKSVTPARIKANIEGPLKAFNPYAASDWKNQEPETVTSASEGMGSVPTDRDAKSVTDSVINATDDRNDNIGEASQKLTSEDIKLIDGLAASGKQKRFIMPPWPVDLGFENWPNKVL